jgi:hypothetical protein
MRQAAQTRRARGRIRRSRNLLAATALVARRSGRIRNSNEDEDIDAANRRFPEGLSRGGGHGACAACTSARRSRPGRFPRRRAGRQGRRARGRTRRGSGRCGCRRRDRYGRRSGCWRRPRRARCRSRAPLPRLLHPPRLFPLLLNVIPGRAPSREPGIQKQGTLVLDSGSARKSAHPGMTEVSELRRVGKGAPTPCPPSSFRHRMEWWARRRTLRVRDFAHPTHRRPE